LSLRSLTAAAGVSEPGYSSLLFNSNASTRFISSSARPMSQRLKFNSAAAIQDHVRGQAEVGDALVRQPQAHCIPFLIRERMKPNEQERSLSFLQINQREGKPRKRGLTEIRGPYYSAVGGRYLEDLFEMMGAYVDSLKFAGGSFTLMPESAVRSIIELCREHDVLVSTGGFIERVLVQGSDAVRQYVAECKRLGFDIIEISAGFVSIPTDDWLRLIELVRKSGLKPKPEVGIQFGAGGATAAAELQAEGMRDPSWAIAQAKRFLEAGAEIIMIESEGITENVDPWRTDVPTKFIDEIGMEKLMFEAADPDVFGWYIKNYRADVNLFVDHSQIVQLECLRAGIWGTKSLWGQGGDIQRMTKLEWR
jgi:phosphosulfolactate synthase (CoM biosynthesis protein A)